MALAAIVEGATSSATDLNQVVNLLNGTTTNTQVTVNGPIGAQLAGTTAPMRYVGGVNTPQDVASIDGTPYSSFTNFYAPISVPLTYGTTDGVSNGTYYGAGDLTWAPGGPMAIGSSAPTSIGYDIAYPNAMTPALTPIQMGPITIGTGGYVCRVHQSAAVTVTSATQAVSCDTVDYDPRGMFRPSIIGSGRAITIPFPGLWGVMGFIHAAENTMSNQWGIALYQTVLSGPLTALTCPTVPSDTTNKYTGAGGMSMFALGFGVYSAGIVPGSQVQLAFAPIPTPPTTYSLDVSGPDRTFLAVWLIG